MLKQRNSALRAILGKAINATLLTLTKKAQWKNIIGLLQDNATTMVVTNIKKALRINTQRSVLKQPTILAD
ncbi:hypothetical protein [Vreelandella olivaria]|uniref:hypothetical protein n=1 Tax=Vreelandella olivaria TaxID=390919 RepID=UPI00201EFE83|nr:hypothetical protein [Halomonas olivaria]